MPRPEMSATSSPLLLLDRDGTIIVEKGFPKDPDDVELIPGAAAAIRTLRALGLRAVVISNQSGIGRGFLTREDVQRVNARLLDLLAAEGTTLDAVYFCPHAPTDGCTCRKPQRTLLDRAAADLGGDLSRSFFVGDKKDDVDAGRNVGATTFLVRTGYGEKQTFPDGEGPDHVVADLAEAAAKIAELLAARSR
ncbi:MAG TPA: HAD family hydrolase [Thermoanaerobaculia bacterium]|nr:HAD family hydrolase [Thermoanaerobaculia bacterium]